MTKVMNAIALFCHMTYVMCSIFYTNVLPIVLSRNGSFPDTSNGSNSEQASLRKRRLACIR